MTHTANIDGLHVRYLVEQGAVLITAVEDQHGASVRADMSAITAEIEATLREETRDMRVSA